MWKNEMTLGLQLPSNKVVLVGFGGVNTFLEAI